MNAMLEEVEVECPFCAETIYLDVDASANEQSYIEDCTVCCRPIHLHILCDEGVVTSLDVSRA